ncbi:MAG: transposase family protein [Rhodobacter sp.]|nr:transposase family protein [Rhodobacter sp.]
MPDPGSGNAQRHSLLDMLVTAPAALVCGAESCADFAGFAADREPLLREFLALRMGCRAMTR